MRDAPRHELPVLTPGTQLHTEALSRGLIDERRDLLQPTYYNPYPLRLIAGPLSCDQA